MVPGPLMGFWVPQWPGASEGPMVAATLLVDIANHLPSGAPGLVQIGWWMGPGTSANKLKGVFQNGLAIVPPVSLS